MVVDFFSIIIGLLVCFLTDVKIRRVRGDGFICRNLQCFVRNSSSHVIDLFSSKVFIRDDHLVFDPHGSFFRYTNVIRVPGILFFRCFSIGNIPETVVGIFDQMFLCRQFKLIVLDIRRIIFFCLFDDFSIGIH